MTGLCLGGITAWKPNTVLCLLLPVADLVLHRHWRLARPLAVGGICGIAAAVSLSLAWLPASAWTQWLTAIAALPDDIIRTDMGNVSPTFLSGFAWLGGPLAAILAACLLAHQTRRPAEPPTSAWWLCTGLLIFNLTARLVWFHYLVLSLPAVLMAATAWCQPDRPSIGRLPRPVAALILCNAVLLLLGIQTLDDAWIGSTPAEHAVRAAFGNGVLLAACVLSNRSEPANHPPDRARTNSSAEPDD